MAMSLQPEAARGADLRHDRRVEFQRRAWCERPNLTLYPLIENLSSSGMFIQTTTPLRPGERLRVSVLEEPCIVLDVEIVRASPHTPHAGVGCRVLAIVQGADSYPTLLRHLSENGS